MTLLILGAEAAALLLVLSVVVAVFYRYESFALFAVLGVFFADAVFIGIPPVEIGSFNVYPQDLISVVLLGTSLLRLAFRRPSALHVVWGIFALTELVSFYAGYQVYGAKASANEFRQSLFLIATTLYFSSIDFSAASVLRLKRAWYITTGALIALALYRWTAEWFSLPTMEAWEVLRTTSPGRITRTLMASQTLFLFQAWLLTGPSLFRNRKRIQQVLAMICLALVFALQHRTVWVAALVSAIYLFGRVRMLLHRPLWLAASATAAAVIILFFALADSSNGLAASLRYSLQEPITDRSTLEWRVTSWQQLLGDDNSPITARNTFLGYLPYGAGLRRRVDGFVVNVSAHNFYVDTLMRTGAIGLTALLLGYSLILFRVRRVRPQDSVEARNWRTIVVSLLISQFAYYFGYSAGYEQGILIGTALSFAVARPAGLARAQARNCFRAIEYRRRSLPLRTQNPLPERGL